MIYTDEFFNVLFLIAIALIFARVLGYLFHKLKQPAVIGEIIAGIILSGLSIFIFSNQNFIIFNYTISTPDLGELFQSSEFVLFAEIGILFLLFISGLETSISKLKKTEKASFYVAIGGVIFPLVLGFLSGILLNFSVIESVVIGLILTATSVGVTVRTLMDLNVLNTDIGATILGGAVFDDIIGIILLAFVMGIGSLMDAVWIGIKIAIFFILFLYIGLKIIDKVLSIGEKLLLPKSFLSITLAILILYSFFAYEAGISGIIGAFVAGILIGQNVRSTKIIEDVKAIGYGFFIPIFFVYVGSSLFIDKGFEISSFDTTILFIILIVSMSIVGKIVGCGMGARLSGMNNKEALQVGVGMIPRMELALIIATAAISHGILTGIVAHTILLTTIILTIVTSLLTPFLIKATFKNKN
ncbi:MAG: cation:proton antiporter [Thermoplasmatales archaeon]|nr:MAG: cation:proton antiporter [Thermoplasmatales archaeon]